MDGLAPLVVWQADLSVALNVVADWCDDNGKPEAAEQFRFIGKMDWMPLKVRGGFWGWTSWRGRGEDRMSSPGDDVTKYLTGATAVQRWGSGRIWLYRSAAEAYDALVLACRHAYE